MSRRTSALGRFVPAPLLAASLVAAGPCGFAGCAPQPGEAERGAASFDLESEPAVRALRHADRAAFDELVNAARRGDAPDASKLWLHGYLRSHVAPRYVALASDDAIREYVTVTIAELEELRERSYYRCFTFLFGDRTNNEVAQIRLEATLSEATRASGLRAITHLIESSGDVPVSIDEEAAWRALDNRVVPSLPRWLGERTMVLRDAVSRDIDRVAACEVMLAVYASAVDLPAPEGPLVMRYLLARQMMAGL